MQIFCHHFESTPALSGKYLVKKESHLFQWQLNEAQMIQTAVSGQRLAISTVETCRASVRNSINNRVIGIKKRDNVATVVQT